MCNGEYGLLLIDKPSNLSTKEVDRLISRKFSTPVGHCGTLDPKVSGVLPVLVGKWRRLMPVFQKHDKVYVGIVKTHSDISRDEMERAIGKFIGRITQTPPRKSAVARRPRERTVYSIRILEHRGRDWLMEFHVESGTYIRKLAHDIGEEIGGAHLSELRRTRAGSITEDLCQTLEEAIESPEFHNPLDFLGLNEVELLTEEERVRKGSPIFMDNVSSPVGEEGEWVVVKKKGKLVCIAKVKKKGRIYASPDIVI